MGAGWYIQVRFCRQDICSVDNWNFSLISAIILSNSETLTPRAQNLRQGIVLKTSFKTRVSRIGLGSFVNITIFAMKYHFIQFVYILNFFRISQIKIYTCNVKTPKGNSGVLSTDTLLSFGLRVLHLSFD